MLITKKERIAEQVIAENEARIRDRMLTLGIARNAGAKEVYDALISKIESDDFCLFEALGRPMTNVVEDCARVLRVTQTVHSSLRGFFLKKSKAEEFLRRIPPQRVMHYLRYDTVDAMLAHEDLFEVYSALRFMEGSEWLNTVFFKQYETLIPQDFEERDIVVRALSDKWRDAAGGFVVKKKHNISHLKELCVVFVIPATLGISGELLRMVSLILHYLREVPFYADMFRRVAEYPATFAQNIISLLRGDVWDTRIREGEKSLWLVVQRYLAKEDEYEWRLSVPRVNPEALHWARAAEDLVTMSKKLDGFSEELAFLSDLDWVGDYFKDELGNDVLVSFNLVDTVMSLVKEREMVKYLYHHQEALWNKIFETCFGREELERYAREYLLKGYFEI